MREVKSINKINNIISKMKEKNIFFFVFLFIILACFFHRLVPFETMNTYTLTYYAIDYSNGLISRGFIGEIFNILGLTTKIEVVVANLFIIFSLMLFICYMLNKLVKKYNNFFILIALMFILNTASFMHMYSNLEFGRFDIYIYIYGLISLYLIYKKKIYFIPIISIIGMLTHENFLVWMAPIISMLLLFEYSNTKDKKYLKVFVINIIILLLMLLVVRFLIFTPNYETKNDFIQALNIKSSLNINKSTISDYYYNTYEFNKNSLKATYSSQNMLDYIIAIMGYLIVVVVGLKKCFIPLYKKAKNKIIYVLLILSTLTPMSLFFVLCDYGRWYMYIMNSFLLLMMYFFFANKNSKKLTQQKMSITMVMYIIILFLIVIIFYPEWNFHIITYGKTYELVNIIKGLF